MIVGVQNYRVAAEELSNNLPSISFPIKYFLSPNKSITTATTPHHLQSLLLSASPSPALSDYQEYWKVFKFFFRTLNFVRAEKVKFFTELLAVLFH